MIEPTIRRFLLERSEDVSGISGIGNVAEGVEFTNGWVTMIWISYCTSFVFFPSIKEMLNIHGHGDKTKIRWLDASKTSL